MKAEDKAYAELVWEVMEQLKEEEESEQIDCGNIAKVAVEIVHAITRAEWLIHEGEVRKITGQVFQGTRDSNKPLVTTYLVPTVSDGESTLLCAWCERPYVPGERNAKHRICGRCYLNGPPES